MPKHNPHKKKHHPQTIITPKKITIHLVIPKNPPKNLNNQPQPTNGNTKKKTKGHDETDVVFRRLHHFSKAPVPRPNLGWDQPSSYPASSQPSARVSFHKRWFWFYPLLLPPGGCFLVRWVVSTYLEKIWRIDVNFWVDFPNLSQDGGMIFSEKYLNFTI